LIIDTIESDTCGTEHIGYKNLEAFETISIDPITIGPMIIAIGKPSSLNQDILIPL